LKRSKRDAQWQSGAMVVDIHEYRDVVMERVKRHLRLGERRRKTTHNFTVMEPQPAQIAGECGEVACSLLLGGRLKGIEHRDADLVLADGRSFEVKTSRRTFPGVTVTLGYEPKCDTILCKTYRAEIGKVWIVGVVDREVWIANARKVLWEPSGTYYWDLPYREDLFRSPYDLLNDTCDGKPERVSPVRMRGKRFLHGLGT
jgi:hypothetical protein